MTCSAFLVLQCIFQVCVCFFFAFVSTTFHAPTLQCFLFLFRDCVRPLLLWGLWTVPWCWLTAAVLSHAYSLFTFLVLTWMHSWTILEINGRLHAFFFFFLLHISHFTYHTNKVSFLLMSQDGLINFLIL